MTVFETLYLLFKTDINKGAAEDVAKLDKQLDDLAKKGKKRTEDESKQYEVLKKQRKELLEETKRQQRETDKLKDSFTGMIESAVGAATAFVSFNALKAGLIDANNLNASLKILQQTYGSLRAPNVKAYGAAVESSTGIKADAFYNFASQNASAARQRRLPFNLDTFVGHLRDRARQFPEGVAPPEFTQIPGAEQLLPFLQLSNEDYAKARKQGFAVGGSDKDFTAAVENQKAVAKTSQAYGELATEIDTNFKTAIEDATTALQNLAGVFKGSPVLAGTEGTLLGVLGTVLGAKTLGWIRGGAAAAAGAGEAVSAVGAAGVAGAAAAGIAATWGAQALGKWGYNHFRGKPSSATESSSNKQASIAFWQSQGYSPAQAAAWAANEQAESSYNPRAQNGSHAGIFQWSAARRAKILAATGIDVLTASHADQLKAAAWEARQMGMGPLALPTNAGDAAAAISNKFEVPATTPYGLLMESHKRAAIANGIYGQIPFAGSSSSSRTTNVKIDKVTIHTQATDAAGIALGFSSEMKNQLRMLASNVDDGELA